MSLRSLVNPNTGLKYVEILPKPSMSSSPSAQSSGYVSKPKNLPPKRKYTKRKKAPTPTPAPVRHVNNLHDLSHQKNELMDHYQQRELPFAMDILHELEQRKHIQHPVSDIRST
ncbi:hypothetical protein TRVA0_048S01024 [Trichomonascus vanleenenianus]|uniref:uncharacterized protein n=1 Tax=Trichomonascus vanleenenianus TaxID=2268995 RepID=UPI003ECA23F3